MRQWEVFVRKFKDMKEGRQELFIKDLSPGRAKYNTLHVIARVSKNKEDLGDNSDLLWIRSEGGIRMETPWYIVVEQELDPWVEGRPWQELL